MGGGLTIRMVATGGQVVGVVVKQGNWRHRKYSVNIAHLKGIMAVLAVFHNCGNGAGGGGGGASAVGAGTHRWQVMVVTERHLPFLVHLLLTLAGGGGGGTSGNASWILVAVDWWWR
jgi:hypothetical protein